MPSQFPTGVANRLKPKHEDLISALSMGILIVQVVLLVSLTRRVTGIEQAISRATGGATRPTPVVLDKTPDDRGQVLGPADAVVTIVEFADFQCPYCAKAVKLVKQLLDKYPGQVRLVFRHFPLTAIHATSLQAAEAAECAGEQGKFWEMHDQLFNNQDILELGSLRQSASEIGLNQASLDVCMASHRLLDAIEQDIADGERYGVNATPTFFVNQRMVLNTSELEGMVVRALTTP